MALGRALGSFLQPIAPGLPGAVNPLTFIGAGLASGNMGAAMGQMANIQQAQQQIGMQEAQMEMLKQRQAEKAAEAQQAARQRQLMQQVALGLLPKQRVEAEGPPTAEGEVPYTMQATPEQAVMALAMPEAVTKAALNPLPIEGGKGGFFNPLTGQIMAAPGPGGAQPVELGDVTKVRSTYSKASQPWQESKRAFERIMATKPTGPGDIALITSYMKVLDPGSTVREGEFATAQNAGGVSEQIRGLYNYLLKSGEMLSPEQRLKFKSQAADFLEQARKEQVQTQEQFSYLARQRGMDLREAVPDYLGGYSTENWRDVMEVPTWQPPVEPATPVLPAAPDPALVEEGLRRFGTPPSMGQRYGQP